MAGDVIYPPPDIRGIIEKTAESVCKHGRDIEQRALKEGTEKLSFLQGDHPYRAYYEMRLRALQELPEQLPEPPRSTQPVQVQEGGGGAGAGAGAISEPFRSP